MPNWQVDRWQLAINSGTKKQQGFLEELNYDWRGQLCYLTLTLSELRSDREMILKYFSSINCFLEKSEAEGDSYTPMLNDMIIVTPQFLGT